jgi:hypothetical protein
MGTGGQFHDLAVFGYILWDLLGRSVEFVFFNPTVPKIFNI